MAARKEVFGDLVHSWSHNRSGILLMYFLDLLMHGSLRMNKKFLKQGDLFDGIHDFRETFRRIPALSGFFVEGVEIGDKIGPLYRMLASTLLRNRETTYRILTLEVLGGYTLIEKEFCSHREFGSTDIVGEAITCEASIH